jgi:hypothetical protein
MEISVPGYPACPAVAVRRPGRSEPFWEGGEKDIAFSERMNFTPPNRVLNPSGGANFDRLLSNQF